MGSGYKNFTAGSVLTASDVNNYLMAQSIMYFATTAARDLAITSPVAGMVAFIDSGDANEGLYVYHGATGGWRKGPGWNAPWGLVPATAGGTSSLGYVINTANQNITTTETALTSMTVTFTAVANRLYRASLFEPRLNNAGGSPAYFEGKLRFTSVAGTVLQSITIPSGVGATAVSMFIETVFTTTAGSKVVLATLQTAAGNFNAERSATAPAIFRVEDIGPYGAPA
jgi:hypothetical protein